MSKYKKYDKSFKQRAVQLALTSEQPTSKTAKDLGILESTLYNWISKAKKDKNIPEVKDETPDLKQLHEELLKLRKENERLRDTCDILKKATAYFANDPKKDSNS
ncbi:transposase [Candidatus Berkiella cookevillensis]|uniref:Transposase n=1 Tax=Candidatus Berkiella cookevillensis TaxID=437022 RepID=A0AAE3HMZ1_9GAMM|nr:transposase [Candidatus Berkiella cookevillensis]MCS5707368.1 transposase [Candidatus Berkiella cookevillensis]MCS5707722.1 transposase [Candidatus Berkiella cookevillensis]MCS5707791.1 transposase [Candidatus Berkiella cookevillensis]MCS5708809.1 transposase [Candidatus Berkiella cookevillensis]MCS5708813.1 transposase [Candidatus Berkiella cookevillensis]